MAAATSRLLADLEAAIAAAASPVEAACRRAERAGLLARQGQCDRAREELAALRKQFEASPHVEVSVWTALAEGLVDYYEGLDVVPARGKIQRAHALATAARLSRVKPLCAAWLAHMAYVEHDGVRLGRYLKEALTEAAADDHVARSRACIVAALIHHFCGRLDLAQPWYAKAREHASAVGDGASLSALMRNRVSQLVRHATEDALFGQGTQDTTSFALLSAESAEHFDAGAGTSYLQSMVPLLRAEVLALQGRYAEALALYDANFEQAVVDGQGWLQCCFLADRAWCHWQLGHADKARADAEAAEDSLARTQDVDDRAVVQARLALLFDALGEADRAARHRTGAQADLAKYRAWQAQLLEQVEQGMAGLGALA